MFFWMSFHQNGFTMTIFARDYTTDTVGRGTYILFDLAALLPILIGIIGIVLIVGKNKTIVKGIGTALIIGGGTFAYYYISKFGDKMQITAELFQHFNPIFIVFLTPVIVGFFTWLRKRSKEPSSPKKIGIGMIITAIGFLILVFAAYGLKSPAFLADEVAQGTSNGRSEVFVSPYWLISTYFTLTIAELFLSPMGISFVSKVSPPQYKGLMQGGWLGATALGNLGAGFIGPFWDKWELWQFFGFLVILCLLSAIFMFSILKRLDRATKSYK
jgi:POT family proton-dependent oligopeptide transporter